MIEFECGFVDGIKIQKVNYSEERHYLTFEDIEENNFDELFLRSRVSGAMNKSTDQLWP